MHLILLGLLAVIAPGAEAPPESPPRIVHWDAEYHVVVRGTVHEAYPNSEEIFFASVVEAPGSHMGVSEDPGQRNIKMKLGALFEQKFGFFWGGTSRVGDPPGPIPKFLVKLEGNGHCLVREVESTGEGVSVVELNTVVLEEPCADGANR